MCIEQEKQESDSCSFPLTYVQEIEIEFDTLGNKLVDLKRKMKGVNLQQLEDDHEKLKESFDGHKKVLDSILTASENCCAIVRRFQDFVSGRLYCFQVSSSLCQVGRTVSWYIGSFSLRIIP